ncbi:MAG: hypothetical protein BAJALOKI1v1_70037 [Promethearchaeota archaeon]|nr:MAG: hypothetical protein BAJALOKI1v1_70037 [Candidatus Lokiarchaeota archaeon]
MLKISIKLINHFFNINIYMINYINLIDKLGKVKNEFRRYRFKNFGSPQGRWKTIF